MRLNQAEILETEEMAEMITLIKSLKGVKIGEKLGFLKSIISGNTIISWKDIIMESDKEMINTKYIKELLANYDNETMRFKGNPK